MTARIPLLSKWQCIQFICQFDCACYHFVSLLSFCVTVCTVRSPCAGRRQSVFSRHRLGKPLQCGIFEAQTEFLKFFVAFETAWRFLYPFQFVVHGTLGFSDISARCCLSPQETRFAAECTHRLEGQSPFVRSCLLHCFEHLLFLFVQPSSKWLHLLGVDYKV